MTLDEKARALLNYLDRLPDFEMSHELDYGDYNHMGAVITAAILQAGLTWKTTVKPRVDRVLRDFPEANTTSKFLKLLEVHGCERVMTWQDHEKPARIVGLAQFLQAENVETENELRSWILSGDKETQLLKCRGVGPKTVDFLKMLVGIPTNAVDRHLAGIVADAGVETSGYQEQHEIINRAADLRDVDRKIFDFSLWKY